ncbi:pentapeptide repeat-containing protein [Micromonospora sp. WMMD882]|uniref:pentapeptide repeat-containing protein n=1 Tax=Micromonospora sp. WMMD882 TaxID=3015151 RepID=UPI00248C1C30|nr:pentapeptide repeat-containing protein [Micromonospora sp. WMMD882]WBB82207.1 pentapeptide repeat-containing protein [Micromonospora sp. WMMD882]
MPELTEDATFRRDDWYAEEIVDRHFVRCSFHDVDLTEATTRGAVFTECVFGGVRFNASRHVDSAFDRCVFTRCVFFDAEFTGCKLVGSAFTECELRPLRVDGGDWSFVTLARADLRGARLDGVRLREVDLTGADLTGATLTGADLSGGQFAGARLVRCDLRGSDLSALDPTLVERRDAVIDPEQALALARALGFQIR